MKKSLIVWGGWQGHHPKENADIFAAMLRKHDFEVQIEDSLSVLEDAEWLQTFDLITPVYTMAQIEKEQLKGLTDAIASGVGLAGTHGMGDAFRGQLNFEWMVGGHFLAHPYVGEYVVELTEVESEITRGLDRQFTYNSEQYYVMTEPSITVLATTQYHHEGKEVTMPVVWTKEWGKGRVFYSALGHVMSEYTDYPQMATMVERGMLWAAR